MERLNNKITLCITEDMLNKVKYFAKQHYFSSVQDYIRMSILINTDVDAEKEVEEQED